MKVFSSYKWLKPSNPNILVCDCKQIPDASVRQDSWAIPMTLYIHPAPSLQKFLLKIDGFRWNLLHNIFFYFRNTEFVLQLFSPTLGIAFEVTPSPKELDKCEWRESHKLSNGDRDALFAPLGIKVVRFTAEEVAERGFTKNIFEPRVREALAEINEPTLPF